MSTYIDANVFVFAALNTLDDPRTIKAKEILQNIADGKETGYTSLLTIDEVIWAIMKSRKDRKLAIEQGARLHQLPIKFIPLITSISLRALKLMQKYNINPRDALHAASCIEVKADKIISDDADFDAIKEVKRAKLE